MAITGLDGVLSVDQAVLASFGDKGKANSSFTSAIRGWKIHEYILLDRPASTVVQGGKECVIRMLCDGRVYGFKARVLDGGLTRPPQFRIAWPADVQSVGLRKHDRVTLQGACTVRLPCGDELDGELHDISAGGCGVYLDEEIPKGVQAGLSVTLSAGLAFEDPGATARSCVAKGPRYFVGFAFGELDDGTQRCIGGLIAETILGQRDASSRLARVLIYHGDAAQARALQQTLEQTASLDARVAPSVVDAFHALRSLTPSALVLPLQCETGSVAELCRMVFGAPGLKELPVFVLGDPASFEAQVLRELGVRDVIGECTALSNVLAGLLGIAVHTEATPPPSEPSN